MGGECYMNVNVGAAKTMDLVKYQKLLRKFKSDFINKQPMQTISGSTLQFYEEEPEDNIFAEFSYPCHRHSWHSTPGEGCWKLFWDPSLEENASSDTHGRCINAFVSTAIAPMWKDLSRLFPSVFYHFVAFDPEDGDVVQGFGPEDAC
eukprot:TRINITY_DN8842_c0_g1_i1.p1 TRINITY_DN8842_c0_g1~~TRINITY_DN8842_c0_g1_i1.p1  ORF type:complete len:148 (-),score=20.29 TRINITY_DN8842_c0_g1_i1:132-575(-)